MLVYYNIVEAYCTINSKQMKQKVLSFKRNWRKVNRVQMKIRDLYKSTKKYVFE